MKNQESNTEATIYTVVTREDYSENTGNPISSESESFSTLEEAEKAYQEEISEITNGHGYNKIVELCKGNEENPLDEIVKIDTCKSAKLPIGAILVYFRHRTYMNYCYEIIEVEKATEGMTYDQLPYSDDTTRATWCCVEDSIEDLKVDYEHGNGLPFNKIQKGAGIIEAFLRKEGIEGYEEEIESEE